MKKLVFSALACVAFAGSGFASSIVQTLNFKEDKTEQQTPCKWRTVITKNGEKYYGDWTYGNCNKTVHQDGSYTLTPIK